MKINFLKNYLSFLLIYPNHSNFLFVQVRSPYDRKFSTRSPARQFNVEKVWLKFPRKILLHFHQARAKELLAYERNIAAFIDFIKSEEHDWTKELISYLSVSPSFQTENSEWLILETILLEISLIFLELFFMI